MADRLVFRDSEGRELTTGDLQRCTGRVRWEIVGDESFVPRQPARGPPVRGVEMLYDVLVFQRRRLFRWRVLRDFSRYSAAPTRITQAKSPAAAVAQDQAASARHVAIWRIFIVLFFPDFYC